MDFVQEKQLNTATLGKMWSEFVFNSDFGPDVFGMTTSQEPLPAVQAHEVGCVLLGESAGHGNTGANTTWFEYGHSGFPSGSERPSETNPSLSGLNPAQPLGLMFELCQNGGIRLLPQATFSPCAQYGSVYPKLYWYASGYWRC